MASNGPRIMAYAYSEGPTTGSSAALVANSTIAVIEQATPGTTTYARPAAPALFSDQLTAWSSTLTTGAPAGVYAVTYDETTQRVTIQATSGTPFRPVMIGNGAVWLGFTQTLTGWSTSWTAESAPAAIAELLGVTVEPAELASRIELTSYRHGRSIAIGWGNHLTHRVRLVFALDDALADCGGIPHRRPCADLAGWRRDRIQRGQPWRIRRRLRHSGRRPDRGRRRW